MALRAGTPASEGGKPLRKRLPIRLLHMSDGLVEGVRNELSERTVPGPVDGVPQPLEQRERQCNRDTLLPWPCRAEMGAVEGAAILLGSRCLKR